MKIIHTADLHLGSKIEASFKEISTERKTEVRNAFLRLVNYAKDNDVKHIPLSGDIFDSDKPFKKDKEFFYENFIRRDLESSFIPHKFESIAKEFLLKLNFAHKIDDIILDIGSYSYDDPKNKMNREFDVVTLDRNGYIQYECKYTNEKITMQVVNEEEAQIKNLDIKFYKLGFISKNGFSDDIDRDKYICYSLDDFFKFND